MERGDPRLAAVLAEQPLDALPHLLRGLVGERDGEHLAGGGMTLADEMRDAGGNDTCLAGARSGEDQERAGRVKNRVTLSWIQTTKENLRARSAELAEYHPRAGKPGYLPDTMNLSMARTLFQKVWDLHKVRTLPNGQTQLYIGLHLVHEVTSPQAFAELRERGWRVRAPERTFATLDHIVPTAVQARPFADAMAESMTSALERNCREHGIQLFDLSSGLQGIVHVIGPEMGLTQPGMTIACGDSHTSTHGAFGAIAFGIGTSQVRDVLASQCLAMAPLKVRRIEVTGALAPGVYAKDVILTIIGRLGVKGGTGYAYEYAGEVIDRMSMDERMTICNMSIEGGARVGLRQPGRDDVRVPEGPAVHAGRRRPSIARATGGAAWPPIRAPPGTTSCASTAPQSPRR